MWVAENKFSFRLLITSAISKLCFPILFLRKKLNVAIHLPVLSLFPADLLPAKHPKVHKPLPMSDGAKTVGSVFIPWAFLT